MTRKQWRILIELDKEDLAKELESKSASNEEVYDIIAKLAKEKNFDINQAFNLYHYSDESYEKGKPIKKESQLRGKFKKEIQEAYEDFSDNIIYALPEKNEEYKSSTKNEYNIEGKPLKRYMDYSPMSLDMELTNGQFKNESDAMKKDIIRLFAKAYKGDKKAKAMLSLIFDYSESDRIEYIMSEATVL